MTDFVTHLRQGGVSIIIDGRGDALPEIIHWGADVGDLTDSELREFAAAVRRPRVPNALDLPLAVAVVPEQWSGWLGRPGLLGSRNGDDWSPRFRTVDLESGAHRLVVTSLDDRDGLRLEITIELTPSGLARTRATLTNLGDEPYDLLELSLATPTPLRASEVLDFAGLWARERQPQRSTLGVGTHLRENRRGRTGPDAAMLLCVGEPGFTVSTGEVWAAHVGFSGNQRAYVDRVAAGVQVLGGGELLLPGEVRLATGDTYESPWIYLAWGIGLDAVAHRFHEFMRARPGHPSVDRPVTLNVWEAVYFDHTLETLVALADRAHEVGVERFVLDDGWFRGRRNDTAGLGDWFVDETVWPEGLGPLAERVTATGMQFGLWFEPEMVNPDSDLARAHPDWILGTSGRQPVLSRNQLVLDVTVPAAWDYLRERISALLTEYPISYIKWDHNRDLTDAGHQDTGRAAVSEQTRAVYRLLDTLRGDFPHLEIESCSSGGGRVDLAILERTDRVWASDCIDPVERQDIDRWTAQLIPPELIGSHIGSPRAHTTGRTSTLAFRAATALFGHLGIEWNLTKVDDLSELAAWVDFYKAQRALLFSGTTVRSDDGDDSLRVRGVVASDGLSALFSVAAISAATTSPRARFRMPGLLPDRRYALSIPAIGEPPHGFSAAGWTAGATVSGALLSTVGLAMPELHPEQAFVVVVTAV